MSDAATAQGVRPADALPTPSARATSRQKPAEPEQPAEFVIKAIPGGARHVALQETVNAQWVVYAGPEYEVEDFERPEVWVAAGQHMRLYDHVRIIQSERKPPRVVEGLVADDGPARVRLKVTACIDMPTPNELAPVGDGLPPNYRIIPAPAGELSKFHVLRDNPAVGETTVISKGRSGINDYESARRLAIDHYNATVVAAARGRR